MTLEVSHHPTTIIDALRNFGNQHKSTDEHIYNKCQDSIRRIQKIQKLNPAIFDARYIRIYDSIQTIPNHLTLSILYSHCLVRSFNLSDLNYLNHHPPSREIIHPQKKQKNRTNNMPTVSYSASFLCSNRRQREEEETESEREEEGKFPLYEHHQITSDCHIIQLKQEIIENDQNTNTLQFSNNINYDNDFPSLPTSSILFKIGKRETLHEKQEKEKEKEEDVIDSEWNLDCLSLDLH
jgi:hypothetical protein